MSKRPGLNGLKPINARNRGQKEFTICYKSSFVKIQLILLQNDYYDYLIQTIRFAYLMNRFI